jgi:glycosyltransferase A (GT-A) superfamily protein (DUF2064 family)
MKRPLAGWLRVVIVSSAFAGMGPADDGGYYLMGLTRSHDLLFSGISWGAPDVVLTTKTRAEAAGLRVKPIPPWYDVDSPADLQRVATTAALRGARTNRLLDNS